MLRIALSERFICWSQHRTALLSTFATWATDAPYLNTLINMLDA